MPDENQNNNNLTSWKQIADFLGVSERTAQTWEEERGLPVKRLAGSRGRVSANRADLERWMKANIKPAPWYASLIFLRYYATIMTGLFLLAVGALIGIRLAENRLGAPADCRLDYQTLIVTDSGGRELWRWPAEAPFNMESYSPNTSAGLRKAWFGKFNQGDRETFTVFPYYPITVDKTGGSLICFSQRGDVKWRYNFDKSVSDLEQTYPPTYVVGDYHVAPVKAGGSNVVFVTSHHTYGDPNRFVIFDGDGKVLGDYWHSGHLINLEVEDVDRDGVNEIFLGGVNNGLHRAILLVLDPRNVHGAFIQPAGDKFQLQGFDAGTQIATILFPRTCINKRLQSNTVFKLSVLPDWIKVDVMEVGGDASSVVLYMFDRNLTPKQVIISDRLKNLHGEMRSRRELDHDFSEAEVDELARNIVIRKIGK